MITLNHVFASHSVFQQNTEVTLRGRATGKTVHAEIGRGSGIFSENTVPTETDGRFSLPLKTPSASLEPWEIRVFDGEETVLTDVLFGEVWLCSGQSNMGVSVKQMPGGRKYAEETGGRPIRIYAQSEISGRDPANDPYPFEPMEDMDGDWLDPWDEEHPERLSALAVAVAKNLSEGALAGIPIGMVQACVGGTPMEAWLPVSELEKDPEGKALLLKERRFPTEENKNVREKIGCMMFQQASVLYNLKIAPLCGIRTRGILWYQGEENLLSWSDRPHTAHYSRMMHSLQSHYGSLFGTEGQSFPVISAQLFPFCYEKPGREREEVLGYYNQMQGELSEAEPEKFTCVPIYDIPPYWNVANNSNVHPMNKFDVGARMAKVTESHTYGRPGMSRPATYRDFRREDGAILIRIHTHGESLRAEGEPKGFWIADRNGLYREASAEITGKDTLRVYSPEVKDPAHAAYQYYTTEMDGNVYCGTLPLCPFATDRVNAIRIEPKPWLHTENNRVWGHLDNNFHALYEPVWRGEKGTEVLSDPLFTKGKGSLRLFGKDKVLVAYTKKRLGERLDLQSYKGLEMHLFNLQEGSALLKITQSKGQNVDFTSVLKPETVREEDNWHKLSFDLTGISREEITRIALWVCTDTPDAGVWMDGLKLI